MSLNINKNKTVGVCHICRRPVSAGYLIENEKVYFEKNCEIHGAFRTLASHSCDDFFVWMENPVVNIPPKKAIVKRHNAKGSVNTTEKLSGLHNSHEIYDECPLHCGVCENHLQTACCVLIDITNRCNQSCPVCFADGRKITEAIAEKMNEEPTLAEIEMKYDFLIGMSEERKFNIQLSGGEPTVRNDLTDIIKLGKQKGFEYIQINTNGKRLGIEEGYAEVLKEAGASVIYMQFDGIDDKVNLALRGEALFQIKKKAIDNCRKAKLPVVLVPTITANDNLNQVGEIISFMLENISVVKGVHFQPMSFFGRYPAGDAVDVSGKMDKDERLQSIYIEENKRVTMFDVMHEIESQTSGMIKYDDLSPISTGHPLCCFYGMFCKEGERVRNLVSKEEKDKGISCCSEMGKGLSNEEIVRRDRDFVLNKWEVFEDECCDIKLTETEEICCKESCEGEVLELDSFLLDIKKNMFTISGMAFMDLSNMDSERLKRCRVQQLTDDYRLIPFCAYNGFYRR